MNKNKKGMLIGIGVVVALSAGLYFYYQYQDSASAMCPDDYGTDDAGSAAYLAATNKWTNDFFDAHPDASLKEWGEARYEFWVDNHCTAVLKDYEQVKAGKADPEATKIIDGILRDVTQP
jgi:hypothetical protein